MRTRLTLRPGQNGTKKLQAKYGRRLIAVRYRYDAERHTRFKTVELIEEVLPWSQPPPARKPHEPVLVRIDYNEFDLRQSIKAAGGVWMQEKKLWQVPSRLAVAMGLRERIVG